jgi:hypothetical protein
MNIKIAVGTIVLLGAMISQDFGRDPDRPLDRIIERHTQCLATSDAYFHECVTSGETTMEGGCLVQYRARGKACDDEYRRALDALNHPGR